MIFILGRSGSGKDSLGQILQKEFDLKPMISYTTRCKRSNEDDSYHHFVKGTAYYTRENGRIDAHGPGWTVKDVIARTQIHGNDYFATAEDYKNADYYIIDPYGLVNLNWDSIDNNDWIAIYINACDEDVEERIKTREPDPDQAVKHWRERREAENEQFSYFESFLLRYIERWASKFMILNNNSDHLELSPELRDFIEEYVDKRRLEKDIVEN